MGEFDHVPTPDADDLRAMFEADGGEAARSTESLNEAAAKRSLLEHQQRMEAGKAADRQAEARARVEQAAGQLASGHDEHLRDVQLHRDLTAHAEVQAAPPVRGEAGLAPETAAGRDTIVRPAHTEAPVSTPAEDRDKVLREIFQKQLPSAWKPEAKKPPREALHKRAARFIGSKLRGPRGKHEKQ